MFDQSVATKTLLSMVIDFNLKVETYLAKGMTNEEAEEYIESLKIQERLEKRMNSQGMSENT